MGRDFVADVTALLIRLWTPVLGAEVAAERAAQIGSALSFDPVELLSERSGAEVVRDVLETARMPHGGNVAISDRDLSNLIERSGAELESFVRDRGFHG